MLFVVAILIALIPTVVHAGDFDWVNSFNLRAEADPSGFRARLATRFNIGDAQISAVLSNVGRPADAYIICRLGEMSSRPTDYVIQRYKSGHGKGWGALAKSLGIKPGSREFHALKSGHDFYGEEGKGKDKGKGKKKEKAGKLY